MATSEAWELRTRSRGAAAAEEHAQDRETPEEIRDRQAVTEWLVTLEVALELDVPRSAVSANGSAPAQRFWTSMRAVVRRVRRFARSKFDSWASEYRSEELAARESNTTSTQSVVQPTSDEDDSDTRRGVGRPRKLPVEPAGVTDFAAAREQIIKGTDPAILASALLALAEQRNPSRNRDLDKDNIAQRLQFVNKPIETVRWVAYTLDVVRELLADTALPSRAGGKALRLSATAQQLARVDSRLRAVLTKSVDDINDYVGSMGFATKARLLVTADQTKSGWAPSAIVEAAMRAWAVALRDHYDTTPEEHLSALVRGRSLADIEPSSETSRFARFMQASFDLVYSGGTRTEADDTGADDDVGVFDYTPQQTAFRRAVDVHEVGEKAFFSKTLTALTYGKAYLMLVTRCSEILGDDAAVLKSSPPLTPLLEVDKARRIHPRDDRAHWLGLATAGPVLPEVASRRWWWLRMLALFVRTELLDRRGPQAPPRYALAEVAWFLAAPLAFAGEQRRNVRVTGPPGTGKTTFVQSLAVLYALLGLFPLGSVQSEDDNKVSLASDLTGQYEGETEQKTRVLFVRGVGQLTSIDEAYSLIAGASRDRGGTTGGAYGRQAIVQLVALATEFGSLEGISIMGYAHDIARLMLSNEGLPRRFPRVLDIRAYTALETLDVFEALTVQHFGGRAEAGPYLVASGLWREQARARTKRGEVPLVEYERAGTIDLLECLKFLTGESYVPVPSTPSDATRSDVSTDRDDSDFEESQLEYLLGGGNPVLTATFSFRNGPKLVTITRHEFVLRLGSEDSAEYALRARAQIASGDIGNMLGQQNASAMGDLLNRVLRKRLPGPVDWTPGLLCATLVDMLEDAGLFRRRVGRV